MKQYLDLLQNIKDNGVEKESGRANMPNTIGLSFGNIKMDLSEGFPLLTTKKMFWKGIVHELLWFLRGETNIKYLVDNKVNIWNGDAYRWYLKYADTVEDGDKITSGHANILHKNEDGSLNTFSIEQFVEKILNSAKLPNMCHSHYGEYTLGDLGKVYGAQWRNQNGVDQVQDVMDGLKTNPYSRYHIIDGWNKENFKEMALPPCHLLYQFIVRPLTVQKKVDWLNENYPMHGLEPWTVEKIADDEYLKDVEYEFHVPKFYLDLNMYQRSCDSLLGIPFNIASMSLLLMLFAKANNMVPGISNWIGGDTHLYINHLPQVEEQLSREPMNLPELNINKELNSLDDILSLTIDDFELINYESHGKIKAELFTGLKK